MSTATHDLETLRDWLRFAVSRFAAGLAFGHGTSYAYDEAAYLLLHSLHLPLDASNPASMRGSPSRTGAGRRDSSNGESTTRSRPVPHQRGLARRLCFFVDERVLVPRSFVGELLGTASRPSSPDADAVRRSSTFAPAPAALRSCSPGVPRRRRRCRRFSADALAVAQRNVADYALAHRVNLVRSDLFASLAGRATTSSSPIRPMWPRRRWPPFPRRISARAAPGAGRRRRRSRSRAHDSGRGAAIPALDDSLVVEVGHNRRRASRREFPRLPFLWLRDRGGPPTASSCSSARI